MGTFLLFITVIAGIGITEHFFPTKITGNNKARPAMKKRSSKEEDVNIFALCFVVVILTLIVEGCDAYCKAHYDQWQEELRKSNEQRMQESFAECKDALDLR